MDLQCVGFDPLVSATVMAALAHLPCTCHEPLTDHDDMLLEVVVDRYAKSPHYLSIAIPRFNLRSAAGVITAPDLFPDKIGLDPRDPAIDVFRSPSAMRAQNHTLWMRGISTLSLPYHNVAMTAMMHLQAHGELTRATSLCRLLWHWRPENTAFVRLFRTMASVLNPQRTLAVTTYDSKVACAPRHGKYAILDLSLFLPDPAASSNGRHVHIMCIETYVVTIVMCAMADTVLPDDSSSRRAGSPGHAWAYLCEIIRRIM